MAARSTASASGEIHVADSVRRNNIILPGPDAGIELAWVRGAKVYHNTIWREGGDGRGIRCIEPVTDTLIAANLVRGRLDIVEGVTTEGNVVGELSGVFVAPEVGDMRLSGPTPPTERAADVADDYLGVPRAAVTSAGALEH